MAWHLQSCGRSWKHSPIPSRCILGTVTPTMKKDRIALPISPLPFPHCFYKSRGQIADPRDPIKS